MGISITMKGVSAVHGQVQPDADDEGVHRGRPRGRSPAPTRSAWSPPAATCPLGYYKDPEKSARTFRVIDGVRYSFPGDLATVNDDGSLNLLGRGSQVINTGGREGVPRGGRGGRQARATASTTASSSACRTTASARRSPPWSSLLRGPRRRRESIIAEVKQHLAGYKAPKHVVFVAEVPRAPNGKADYRTAREQAVAQADPVRARRRPRPPPPAPHGPGHSFTLGQLSTTTTHHRPHPALGPLCRRFDVDSLAERSGTAGVGVRPVGGGGWSGGRRGEPVRARRGTVVHPCVTLPVGRLGRHVVGVTGWRPCWISLRGADMGTTYHRTRLVPRVPRRPGHRAGPRRPATDATLAQGRPVCPRPVGDRHAVDRSALLEARRQRAVDALDALDRESVDWMRRKQAADRRGPRGPRASSGRRSRTGGPGARRVPIRRRYLQWRPMPARSSAAPSPGVPVAAAPAWRAGPARPAPAAHPARLHPDGLGPGQGARRCPRL